MKIHKKYLILFLLSFSVHWVAAQNGLKIEQIFKNYGKQNGSILIELANDVLGNQTKINLYKSLIISSSTRETTDSTLIAIGYDIKDGSKLIETQKDGKLELGYYFLKKKENSPAEYILYKNKSRKLTLIYIRGNFPPQQLEQELDKLKDLFITVNKKRIKL